MFGDPRKKDTIGKMKKDTIGRFIEEQYKKKANAMKNQTLVFF